MIIISACAVCDVAIVLKIKGGVIRGEEWTKVDEVDTVVLINVRLQIVVGDIAMERRRRRRHHQQGSCEISCQGELKSTNDTCKSREIVPNNCVRLNQ